MMEPLIPACPQFLALPKSNVCMRCKQDYSQHQAGVFANQLQARQQEVTGAWVNISITHILSHMHKRRVHEFKYNERNVLHYIFWLYLTLV